MSRVTAETPDAPWPTLAEVKLAHVRATVARCGGDRAAAARLLGVSARSVYNWLGPPEPEPQPAAPAAPEEPHDR